MTREELIKQTANKYFDNYVPDICGIYDEDIWDAFISGAKWADNNPKNIWHPSYEEPTDDLAQILYQDNYGDCWLITKSDIIILACNWEHFASVNVRRWVYVSDLLPKGGKK